jgi:hypothetical protein
MRNILLLSLVVVFFALGASPSQAFTKRQKSLDGGSEASGDALSNFSHLVSTPSDAALSLARSASEGAGRLKEDGALCYRAVKQIIADAFGKDLLCVRNILSSRGAKDAGGDLTRFGFVKDMSKCKEPGTVRVYKGVRSRKYRPTDGDIWGHVEVVGDEGMYHSFYSNTEPIDEDMAGRRILTGCYVPDMSKISSGPAAKCPEAKRSLKTHRPPGSQYLKDQREKKGAQ